MSNEKERSDSISTGLEKIDEIRKKIGAMKEMNKTFESLLNQYEGLMIQEERVSFQHKLAAHVQKANAIAASSRVGKKQNQKLVCSPNSQT